MTSPRYHPEALRAIDDHDYTKFVRLATTEIADLSEHFCVYLHQATLSGRLDIVEWLLRQPRVIDYLRKTPSAAHYFFYLPPAFWRHYINGVGPFSETSILDNKCLWPAEKTKMLAETMRSMGSMRAKL
jgi:hypothetical protein